MTRIKFQPLAPALVWAAAAVAYRMNGGYVKVVSEDTTTGKTNRGLVEAMLHHRVFTEEELAEGNAIRDHFKGYAFKLLCGQKLDAWEKSAHEAAECEMIESSFTFGVICALPATYYRERKRAETDARIAFARGGYIAEIGSPVEVTGEVLKQVWSRTWGTYYFTMITADAKVLFFSMRQVPESVKVGSIITVKGTVKAHRENSTQLNRAKVI